MQQINMIFNVLSNNNITKIFLQYYWTIYFGIFLLKSVFATQTLQLVKH